MLCIHQKSFLLPHDSFKFVCWDIRELQQEKTVAYPQALQFGAEKANLPTQGQPHLLVGSIVELREGMKCYVSSDKDVFSGVALPEEPSITQSKEAALESAQPMQTDSPVEEAIMKVSKELTKKEQPLNQFPGSKEVIHPSRLVVATGQIPPILQGPKQRPCSWSSCERMVQWQWEDESKVQSIKSEPPSPTKELEIARWVMLPPGFMGVTACLQRDPSPEKVHEVPQVPLRIAAVLGPTMATMSASCIVKDEATGVTYMDPMTTSMGQVALSGPKQEASTQGPIIEDITGLM